MRKGKIGRNRERKSLWHKEMNKYMNFVAFFSVLRIDMGLVGVSSFLCPPRIYFVAYVTV